MVMKLYYWLGALLLFFSIMDIFFCTLYYGKHNFRQNHAFLVYFDNYSADFTNSFNFSVGKIIMNNLDRNSTTYTKFIVWEITPGR